MSVSSTDGFMLKAYPTGRAVVYRKVSTELAQQHDNPLTENQEDALRCVAAHGIESTLEFYESNPLSPSLDYREKFAQPPEREPVKRGRRGMPREAQQRVKDYVDLLERRHGSKYLTFGTVTVPSLPPQCLSQLHENWHHFCKLFRQKLVRELKRAGLDGSVVYVTEIQPKRFAATGKPYLHLHFICQGRKPGQTWGVSTRRVREITREAIATVTGYETTALPVCRLEAVKKSASSYIGKYMSKGAQECQEAIENGYEGWLPRQWWGSTRDLPQEFKKRTRVLKDDQGVFWDAAEGSDPNVWECVHPIQIQDAWGQVRTVAWVGYLTERVKQSLGVGEMYAELNRNRLRLYQAA